MEPLFAVFVISIGDRVKELTQSPTNDIAHASSELIESAVQNRYISRYLYRQEARAISVMLAIILRVSKDRSNPL